MHRYQNNAFRILGLLPTATLAEITSRANEIKVKKSLGASVNYEYDFSWMGPLDRSEESVIHALQRLEDPVMRLKEEMFWFWACGETDLRAINYLVQNRRQLAHDLWSKTRLTNIYIEKDINAAWDNDPKAAARLDISLAFNYKDIQPHLSYSQIEIDNLWEENPRKAVEAEISIAINHNKIRHFDVTSINDVDKLWSEDPRKAVEAELAMAVNGKYKKIDPESVSAYVNQVFLAHCSVIAEESDYWQEADEKSVPTGDIYWKKWQFVIKRLSELSKSKVFWNEIARRAKNIGDPRLNDAKLCEIRNEYLEMALEPNFSFIGRALNSDAIERATRHSSLLLGVGLPNDVLKKGINKALCCQIDTIKRHCDSSKQALRSIESTIVKSSDSKVNLAAAIQLADLYSDLIKDSKQALCHGKAIDINGVSDLYVACDDLAQHIRNIATALNNLHIGIYYYHAADMMDEAVKCATSDFVKERLEKDRKIIFSNMSNYHNGSGSVAAINKADASQGKDEVYYEEDAKRGVDLKTVDEEKKEDSVDSEDEYEGPRREGQCLKCIYFSEDSRDSEDGAEEDVERFEVCEAGEDIDKSEECESFEIKDDENAEAEDEDSSHVNQIDSSADLFSALKDTDIRDAAIFRANLQRTGFYKTKGLYRVNGVRWSFNPNQNESSGVSDNKYIRSTPLIMDGTLYAHWGNGNIYALNASNGRVKWSCAAHDICESTPVIAHDKLICSTFKRILALNMKNGEFEWGYQGGFSGKGGSPAFSYDAIFFGTGGFDQHGLITLNAQTGKSIMWFPTGSMAVFSSPAILGDSLYFGRQGFDDTYFFAVNKITGNTVWKFRVPGKNGASIAAAPVIANNMVFFKSRNESLYALNIGTGQQIWSVEEDFGDNSCPIYHDGKIFVCGQSMLTGGTWATIYAFESATGKEIWRFDMKDQGFDGNHFSPIATDGLVYCAAGCYVYAIDMKTGQRVWEYEHETRVNCITVDNGILYLACENGCIYALS